MQSMLCFSLTRYETHLNECASSPALTGCLDVVVVVVAVGFEWVVYVDSWRHDYTNFSIWMPISRGPPAGQPANQPGRISHQRKVSFSLLRQAAAAAPTIWLLLPVYYLLKFETTRGQVIRSHRSWGALSRRWLRPVAGSRFRSCCWRNEFEDDNWNRDQEVSVNFSDETSLILSSIPPTRR